MKHEAKLVGGEEVERAKVENGFKERAHSTSFAHLVVLAAWCAHTPNNKASQKHSKQREASRRVCVP
jgi:hypothetical protein